MRPRHACLLALTAAAISGSSARAMGEPEAPARRQITIIASPSTIPVGAQCLVEMSPESNDRGETLEISHEGKIAEAKDDGISLTIASTRQVITKGGSASRLPVVGRLFRNIGIGHPKPGEERKVWIPAEKIRSVKLLPDTAP